MYAQLIPIDGGAALELTKEITVIGRNAGCDIRLDHKSVSKIHCVLVKTDGLILLRDLGSTNGTRVNGTRVRRAALLPNDKLQVAGFAFRLTFGPDVVPVSPHEATQRIEAADVARLMKSKPPDSGVKEHVEVKLNLLPDAYPEEKAV